MHRDRKPWWQQATALVTVTTGGAITGFTFVPGSAATVTSPASVPVHLLALEQAARASDGQLLNARAVGGDSAASATADALLRSAIVNVAKYYLGLAQTRTPAQMEALIWDNTSVDGGDHGPSCAALASLALELAAQAVGQRSWVTGGTSYPWPLPPWADVRVDENPASPGITSMVQDAEANGRWHALGDGYAPQPGDWVLFDEHVEIVTSYSGGVLDTIGANSDPNLTVNAHSFSGSLAADGVQGFVDNGHLEPLSTVVTTPAATSPATGSGAAGTGQAGSAKQPSRPAETSGAAASTGLANVPGVVAPSGLGAGSAPAAAAAAPPPVAAGTGHGLAIVPGIAAPGAAAPFASTPVASTPTNAAASRPTPTRAGQPAASPSAGQPNAKAAAPTPTVAPSPAPSASPTASHYRQYSAPAAGTPGTSAQQAFINLVAPGAMAGQQRYGVPAAVTIAQAIDESGWGQSELTARYNNLFGIKGDGPAGSVTMPTAEFEGGQWVTIDAQFRVYYNVAQSITDHDELLATSGYYTRAMADRSIPDAFANDLTGVYATDPNYGANLIALMKLYNLYRFDTATAAPAAAAGQPSPNAPASAAAQPSGRASATAHHPAAAHPTVTATSAGAASIPGVAAPMTGASVPAASSAPGTASIPGLAVPGHVGASMAASHPAPHVSTPQSTPPTAGAAVVPGLTAPAVAVPTGTVPAGTVTAGGLPAGAVPTVAAPTSVVTGPMAAGSFGTRLTSTRPTATRTGRGATVVTTAWYQPELPGAVTTAYFAAAKGALGHAEALYRDVAAGTRIPWQVLAACDWMQCKAHPRYSPVQGEKLGTVNRDGTSFRTRSQALAQCTVDLLTAAAAIYAVDLTAPGPLSVRSLAEAFAAFRWGSLLRRHGVSAMEFPYSVAGLTARHTKMHWPDIDAPDAPDRPGARFREPFGAVPVVLSLGYPATV